MGSGLYSECQYAAKWVTYIIRKDADIKGGWGIKMIEKTLIGNDTNQPFMAMEVD